MLHLKPVKNPKEGPLYLVKYKGGVFTNSFTPSLKGYFHDTMRGKVVTLPETEEIYEIEEVTGVIFAERGIF